MYSLSTHKKKTNIWRWTKIFLSLLIENVKALQLITADFKPKWSNKLSFKTM